MNKVQLTSKAIEDLDSIWNFTKNNWSQEQADKYFNNLLDEIDNIPQNLGKCKSYNHIVAGFKALKCQSHNIFFIVNINHDIDVRRILHKNMDFKSRLT